MIETPSAATECTLSKYSTFPLFQQEAWPLFVESWTPQPIFSDQICKNSGRTDVIDLFLRRGPKVDIKDRCLILSLP
ncbi:Hypothetical predicted protein [Olea europaea subsp. europaea]|uniref:Uncharacterized protein n=1 Tax=Olea europaea subsp. europaea TaxID=158383 RepID=A0A8S0SRB2_OLEEU|nr:Hypothetical predicted protein [Olea europaea subsp. europaea]